MISSMTAFTRVQKQLDSCILCWELKSVNHRYLELSFRLPDRLRFLENSLRATIREKISRGKLECQLKYQPIASQDAAALQINEGVVVALMQAGDQLALQHQLPNDLTLSTLLPLPGVLQTMELDAESFTEETTCLFQEALTQLVEIRQNEGRALKSHLQARLESLQEHLTKAHDLAKPLVVQTRAKLTERLQILATEIDKTRFEQEVVLLLTRLDVTEELDRLQTHCAEVARVLLREGANGRRLDFLMQELNREANTLSAKSDSIELTQTAVDIKVLIEQMREQIQNIE